LRGGNAGPLSPHSIRSGTLLTTEPTGVAQCRGRESGLSISRPPRLDGASPALGGAPGWCMPIPEGGEGLPVDLAIGVLRDRVDDDDRRGHLEGGDLCTAVVE